MIGWIILAVVVIVVIWVVALYNRLVRLKFRVRQAWSDVDVQLKRRYNLIPNLVETVKGYAAHERETFTQVTEARAKAMQVTAPGRAKGEAENALQATLKSLFAVSERYPTLKANENFLDLQANLSKLEEEIQLSRRYYNAVVRDFNTLTEVFPSNLIANTFRFQQFEYFLLPSETEGEIRETPRVKFR